MAATGPRRTRSERVAALELPPGKWERAWASLRRRDVLARIGLALLAALAISVVIKAWKPPFSYRVDDLTSHDIVVRAPFTKVDEQSTALARQRARDQIPCTYIQDPDPLERLRAQFGNTVVPAIVAATTLDELAPELWTSLQPPIEEDAPAPKAEDMERRFAALRAVVASDETLSRFEGAVAAAFAPLERHGVLHELPEEHTGSETVIRVRRLDDPTSQAETVFISEVLIGAKTGLRDALRSELGSAEVADQVLAWMWPQLQTITTLRLDESQTKRDQDKAAEEVENQLLTFDEGQLLLKSGKRLTENDLDDLRIEYQATLAQRDATRKISRAAAATALVFVALVLSGIYMRYSRRGAPETLKRLILILALAVIAVAFSRWAAAHTWRAEIIPLMLFGMTIAIAYDRQLAVLFTAVLSLVVVLAVGHGLYEFLLLMGVTSTACLSLGTIRSRSKLIYVGLLTGLVAVLFNVAWGLIEDQPLDWRLLEVAGRSGLSAVAAGFLMTGLLPFIEQLFGVLTDLSLLELGDVAHPLLQELVRRAPSTYNHSVTVGSIAEAAADSIGARGLLVRVGAYFHDIGKMLKPGYFIENQGAEANRHETLVPAMSTLVIIAHIKDGADLARQHHLPQPIIDLIEQHHGTTLVGYFYQRATAQKEKDPNADAVDESTYRYPGPKPQTKEAGVLMLADNVESASRTLVDPTPARIESLVREVAERRLRGGQFDESGLTLRELRTIEKSLVKSLTSIYHGRIKYPDQRTA